MNYISNTGVRIVLHNLIVIQLVKKFHTSCGTMQVAFSGFRNGVVEISVLPGCDVLSPGDGTTHPGVRSPLTQ